MGRGMGGGRGAGRGRGTPIIPKKYPPVANHGGESGCFWQGVPGTQGNLITY